VSRTGPIWWAAPRARLASAISALANRRPLLFRILRIGVLLGGLALLLFVLDELGIPVATWIHALLRQVRKVPPLAIAGGVVFETLQTLFAAIAWLTILRAAFPHHQLPLRPVLASYAVAVALNSFLPANVGTLVMMLMFVALIAEATFAAVFSGFLVQKTPFTIINFGVYAYLFATVSGSLSIRLDVIADHPALSGLVVAGTIAFLVLLGRIFWRRARKLRSQLRIGGAVLWRPRRLLFGVVLPNFASFAARLAIVAVFLAAYSIPVSFHTVIAVTGANSISSSVTVTPGGVGVTQAMNVAALGSKASSGTATRYSVAQQLIVSAWDVVFAVILVAWVFGWSGGKQLVKQSYAGAAAKRRELKNQRREQRAARGGPPSPRRPAP
jgi:uncharacterized membrane protein YbhN (UPF0104 family)